MSIQTLEELVDELSEEALSSPDGLPSAMLHLIDQKGEMTVAGLMPAAKEMLAYLVRLVVAKQDPVMAVLIVEAISAVTKQTAQEETDPDLRRVLRGEIRPSGLPLAKQKQMLMVYGEDRVGNEITRMWVADPPVPKGVRRNYKPWEQQVVQKLPSRLPSLYSFRELMVEKGLTEYRARTQAREHATKELARLGMIEQDLASHPRFGGGSLKH